MSLYDFDLEVQPTYLDVLNVAAGVGVFHVPITGLLYGDVVQIVTLAINPVSGVGPSISKAVDMTVRSAGYFEWVTQQEIDAHFSLSSADLATIAAGVYQYSVTLSVTRNGTTVPREVQAGNFQARTAAPVALIVSAVGVTPSSATQVVGTTVQLTATPVDGFGAAVVNQTIAWSSSNTGVATVSVTGLVTFTGTGLAVITATCQGVNGTSFVQGTTLATNKQVSGYLTADGLWAPRSLDATWIGAGTFAGVMVFGAGATVSGGQALTLTGATVTGAPTWGSSQAITLSTAAQPNVTSLGTLTALTIGGNLTFSGASRDIIAGTTDLAFRNNANTFDNLTITDAGVVTVRAGLTVTAGGVTVTGASTITGTLGGLTGITSSGTATLATVNASGLVTANGGLTVAAAQTLTVTGATITGLTAASVGAGTFPVGAFVFQGAVSGVTTLATSSTINGQTISAAASFTGSLTVANGFTVSAGTSSVQALTTTQLSATGVGAHTFGSNAGGSVSVIFNAAVATTRQLTWQTAGASRWSMGANNAAEGGANAGSQFFINAFDDTGVFLDSPLIISRASAGGSATWARTMLFSTVGTHVFGTGAGAGVTVAFDGAAGTNRDIRIRTGGLDRWIFRGDGTAEAGANAGTLFVLSARDDTGALIDNPITIIRASGGIVTVNRNMTVTGTSLTVSPGATNAALTVGSNASTAANIAANGAAGTSRDLKIMTASLNRWVFRASSTAEAGANAGSNLQLLAYDDAGVNIDTPLSIVRAAGGVITASRAILPNPDATLDFGATTLRWAVGYFATGVSVGGTSVPSTADAFRAFGVPGTTAYQVRFIDASGNQLAVGLNATTRSVIQSTSVAGSTGLDVNPVASDGVSTADVRFFRSTNTSGQRSVQILRGDNSTTIDHQFAAAAVSSYLYGNESTGTFGSFGLGVSSPNASSFHFARRSATAVANVYLETWHDALGSSAQLIFRRALAGAATNPGIQTVVSSSTFIGAIIGQAYDSAAFSTGAQISMITTELWNLTSRGALIRFSTVSNATTALTTRWDIAQDGSFKAGTDNSWDIGAAGASRPRTGYFGTSVVIGADPGGTDPLRNAGQSTLAGDVFIGSNAGANRSLIINAAAATLRSINFQTAGVNRWLMRANADAESGADAGSAWELSARTDAGALIDLPIQITRAAGGAILMARPVTITGILTAQATTANLGTNAGAGINVQINGAVATTRQLVYQTAGSARWTTGVNNAAESGGNAGSDWYVAAKDDTGATIDTPITVTRAATGSVTIIRKVSISNTLTVTAGGVTVSAGTTAVQALTATTGVFSSTVSMTGLTATTGAFSSNVTVSGTTTVTSASASALAVGLNGATNPAFVVDSSVALQVAGLKVTAAVTAGTVGIAVIDSGANANLSIDAKGSGTISFGASSTGAFTFSRASTFSTTVTVSAGGLTVTAGGLTVNGGATTIQNLAASAGGTFGGQVSITSTSGNAIAVGAGGLTNPAFRVDASTASQVAGLSVVGAATGGTVAVSVIDSGANASLSIDAKGSGTITVGGTSTGSITLNRFVTFGNGFTTSAGTSAFQAITATTGSFTSTITVTSGSITTSSQPVFTATQTWNDAAVAFTGWKLNITPTLFSATAKLFDIQSSGTSKFYMNYSTLSTTGVFVNLDGPGGFSVNQGTITAAAAVIAYNASATWNNAAQVYEMFDLNLTDTASDATSTLAQFRVGGISKFAVRKDGQVTAAGMVGLANHTNDLGSSSLFFRRLYADATVVTGATVTYSASMTPDAILGERQIITATNGTAFTINAPTNATTGAFMIVTIRNGSGGALGVATWNAVFKMAAWTQPANGFSRSISFHYDGTNWIEYSRITTDVPN